MFFFVLGFVLAVLLILALLARKPSTADTQVPLENSPEWTTAVHEAGHCLVAHHTKYCPPTHLEMRPSTQPEAAGILRHKIEKPNLFGVSARLKSDVLFTDDILYWEQAVISLGALAAELEITGKARSGPAAMDIQHAVSSLKSVARMDCPMRGWQTFRCTPFPLASVWRGELDTRTSERVQVAWRQARFLIRNHRKQVEILAKELLSKSVLNRKEILRILEGRKL